MSDKLHDDWFAWYALKDDLVRKVTNTTRYAIQTNVNAEGQRRLILITEQEHVRSLKGFLTKLDRNTSHYEDISKEITEELNKLTLTVEEDNRILGNIPISGAKNIILKPDNTSSYNETTGEKLPLPDGAIGLLIEAMEEIRMIRAASRRNKIITKKLEAARNCYDENNSKIKYIKSREKITENWFDPSDGVYNAQLDIFPEVLLQTGIVISGDAAIKTFRAINKGNQPPKVKWHSCPSTI